MPRRALGSILLLKMCLYLISTIEDILDFRFGMSVQNRKNAYVRQDSRSEYENAAIQLCGVPITCLCTPSPGRWYARQREYERECDEKQNMYENIRVQRASKKSAVQLSIHVATSSV